MKILQLAGAALLLVAFVACATSWDKGLEEEDVWLSQQDRLRPSVVPTLVPQDMSTLPRSPFMSVSVGDWHICGVRENGSADCGTLEAPDGPFTSVSVGEQHICGVREGGSIACWGDIRHPDRRAVVERNIESIPTGVLFTSVSAGNWHTCGVREDGLVACWGDDGVGQATPPEGAFTSVSVGYRHTCGVREDGLVACWGANEFGQATPLEGAFTSVDAGGHRTCGVRVDGSVACWGGQDPARSAVVERNTPTLPEGAFTSVSIGWDFGCGVRENKTVTCWQFGGSIDLKGVTAPPQGTFKSVSIRGDSACGVREAGSVACWGWLNHIDRPALLITGRTSTSLTVEWWNPSGNGPHDYYQVHVSRSLDGPYSFVTSNLDEGTHVTTGLEPDATYHFVVLGCDPFGCSSQSVIATTEIEGPVNVPAIPTEFRGEKLVHDIFPDHAKLDWDEVEGATYYELWKGSHPDLPFEMLVQISAPLGAQAVDIDPNRETGFFGFGAYSITSWKVRACNKAGCSPFSNIVTVE